ncbi:MAG: MFS transporter [Bradyrhizobium sp.]|nr:MFS transporter [Bradyrhizobium sp.]
MRNPPPCQLAAALAYRRQIRTKEKGALGQGSLTHLKSNMVVVLIVLAIGQIIGWGTIGLPAVVGRQLAADLGMDIVEVFAGTSVLYLVMGFCAPLLANAFGRHGARRVMIAGAAVATPGFLMLAFSRGEVSYFTAWMILGSAGSACLSTATYILLSEIAGSDAKRSIGALMLMTGLSSTIFWPITALLSAEAGWRVTCLVYAAAMGLVCVPLYMFGLPQRARAPVLPRAVADPPMAEPAVVGRAADPKSAAPGHGRRKAATSTLYLIIAAISLNAFIAFGLGAVLIELLKSQGLAPAEAIALGSSLGIVQVSARGIDFLGGGRWDGVTTGLFAGAALPVAMLLLMLGQGLHWSIVGFMVIYGLGSGALAVARATIPLVFYDSTSYVAAASRIALPLNLMSAVAPAVLAGVLTRFGADMLLGLALLCSCAALAVLAILSQRRPRLRDTAQS